MTDYGDTEDRSKKILPNAPFAGVVQSMVRLL